MTELEHKKSKEGRYRVEPETGEIEPLIEPLSGLDDGEDAIDRLLLNTGFDAEEEFFPENPTPTEAQILDSQAFEIGKFDSETWIPLRTDEEEPVEPVDLVSPLDSLAHEPTFSVTEALTMHSDFAAAEDHAPSELHAPFAQMDDADELMEPAAPDSSAAEVDPFQTPVIGSASLAEEAGSGTAALPADWSRMLSAQEEIKRQMAYLENKTGNTARLSYAALGLSLTALCAALAVGFLDIRTRTEVQAELDHSKDMMALLEDDMNGLSEKIADSDSAAEDSSGTSGHISGEPSTHTDDESIAIEAPYPAPAESIQAALKPAVGLRGGNSSAPSVQNARILLKAAVKTAFSKPSPKAPDGTDAVWSVNLAAFRQPEEARKKAAEFKRKGLAVKVTKVKVKQATWYRLSVPGFKTREAASTHSAQLKKLLRLNSVWVANT